MTTTTHDTPVPNSQPAGGSDAPVVARAGRYYRNTRYIVSLALVLVGAWFAYDGWVTWPREARMNKENPKTGTPHSDLDIWFQKALGSTLPPLGIGLLCWTLYRSRGAYRMHGDVVSVPGHPDVRLDAVRQMDMSKWDRKGIARVEYERGPGDLQWLVLDDFVYDRPPTDTIVKRIEAHLAPEIAPAAASPVIENEDAENEDAENEDAASPGPFEDGPA